MPRIVLIGLVAFAMGLHAARRMARDAVAGVD